MEMNYGCVVFVGAVPYDASREDYEKEVHKWGNVVKTYYHGTNTGWGTVEFRTNKIRDQFLENKKKHVIMNQVVDVKAYVKRQDRGAAGNQVPTTANKVPGNKPAVGQQSKLDRDSPVPPQPVVAQTAVVLNYISEDFGIIKTNGLGHGFFHSETAYICTVHGKACKITSCPHYVRYSKSTHGKIQKHLPQGSTISFFYRNVQHIPNCDFQVTLLWHQVCKKPNGYITFPNSVLNKQLTEFLSLIPKELQRQMTSAQTPMERKIEPQIATFVSNVSNDEAVVTTKEYGSFVVSWQHLQHFQENIDTSVPISTYINPNMIMTVLLRYDSDTSQTKKVVGLKFAQKFEIGAGAPSKAVQQPIAPIKRPQSLSIGDLDDDLDKLIKITNFLKSEFQFLDNHEKLSYPSLATKLLSTNLEGDVARYILDFEREWDLNIDITTKLQITKKTWDMLVKLKTKSSSDGSPALGLSGPEVAIISPSSSFDSLSTSKSRDMIDQPSSAAPEEIPEFGDTIEERFSKFVYTKTTSMEFRWIKDMNAKLEQCKSVLQLLDNCNISLSNLAKVASDGKIPKEKLTNWLTHNLDRNLDMKKISNLVLDKPKVTSLLLEFLCSDLHAGASDYSDIDKKFKELNEPRQNGDAFDLEGPFNKLMTTAQCQPPDVYDILAEHSKRLTQIEFWQKNKEEEDKKWKDRIQLQMTQIQNKLDTLQLKASSTPEEVVRPTPPGRRKVRIVKDGSTEILELNTNDEGELKVSSVLAVLEGTTALKYPEKSVTRICNKVGDIFEMPEDGWKDRLYTAIQPNVIGPLDFDNNIPLRGRYLYQILHFQTALLINNSQKFGTTTPQMSAARSNQQALAAAAAAAYQYPMAFPGMPAMSAAGPYQKQYAAAYMTGAGALGGLGGLGALGGAGALGATGAVATQPNIATTKGFTTK